MSEIVELKLYSPLQADIIDRDSPGHVIPLLALNPEQEEYLEQVMSAVQQLMPQEDARNAFALPRDWSGISEKIISFTRAVEKVHGRLYGVFSCRSNGELDVEETNLLKCHWRDQWENGWGEGYAHCPSEGSGLGLYIHFWQDFGAPLLTREQLEHLHTTEQSRLAVTEITPDTFWTLIEQSRNIYGQDQGMSVYWLVEQLQVMGSEQALNFHSIMHGYMELADKYGLWNAAILIHEDGCHSDGFMDFRTWLIAQGKETYLAALKDPDSLADVPVCEDCRYESLLYAGDMAYERLTRRMCYKDVDLHVHQQILTELRRDIVYGAGIEYPHEWTEVAAYLPRLCAAHTTPEELRACAHRGRLWNYDDPKIQKARATAPKKKKSRSKGGETR